MKKLLLTAGIIILIFQIGEAQKYKVKRRTGAVLKDKEEVAKVEGKVSAFKESYMDMYQNDELVLSVKQNYFSSPYKEMESFPFYEFEFPELGIELNIRANYTFTNEKQIIRILMGENGLHIYKEGFKKSEIEQLKASDVVQSIHKDTTEWNETLASWREHIEKNDIQVDKEENNQISFRKVDPKLGQSKFLPENSTHFIYRKPEKPNGEKNPIVGAISYRNIPSEQYTGREIHEIQIFKRVKEPIEYLGSKSYYVPYAYCDLTNFSNAKKYISYMDGEVNTYLSFSDKLDDSEWRKRVQIILEDLVEKGML
ncbi:MAG: hypothetical protein ACQETL_00300 [Bacteroidota bacterium]